MQNDVTLRNTNSHYKKKIHLFEWLIIIDHYIRLWLLHTICISLFKLKISFFYYSIMNFSDVEKLRSSVLISFPVFYSRNIPVCFISFKTLFEFAMAFKILSQFLNYRIAIYLFEISSKDNSDVLSLKDKYEDRWQIWTI